MMNNLMMAAGSVVAAVVLVSPASAATLARADIYMPDKARQEAWVEAAGESSTGAFSIQFKNQNNPLAASQVLRLSDAESVYFYEPELFSEAMTLFKGRKYAEALKKFEECSAAYKSLLVLPGNYASLSRFYAMECQRKANNIEGLIKIREGFDKKKLALESDQIQFDLYLVWDAVAKSSWDRLVTLGNQWLERDDLSGGQRAQVGYCLGMAYEKLERPGEALIAYGIGMAGSGGTDESVMRESALGSLRTYLADPQVKTAIELYGTEHEAPASTGHLRLLEAARLAAAYPTRFSGGRTLPAEFAGLLKYKPETKDGEKAQPAKAE